MFTTGKLIQVAMWGLFTGAVYYGVWGYLFTPY